MPEEVQLEGLRSIEGFENAKMFRPGYAVEYDYFPPTQLKHSLETKLVENLFLADKLTALLVMKKQLVKELWRV